LARQKLAEAKAHIGTDAVALGDVAKEVDALEDELARFEAFFSLIDQARDAEASKASLSIGPDQSYRNDFGRNPAKAVPFILQALSRYRVSDDDNWTTELKSAVLKPGQVQRIRRATYEQLLWLTDDILYRQEDHHGGQKLSKELAARRGLVYLGKAEAAYPVTSAFYRLRSRCREALGDKEAAQADARQALQTPGTIAPDHFLLGLEKMWDNTQEAVKEFEAALRIDPTHYWSLWWLGSQDYRGPDVEKRDPMARVMALTGCIMKRPDHVETYLKRGWLYESLGRSEDAIADYSKAIELDPNNYEAWGARAMLHAKLSQWDKSKADAAEEHRLKIAVWSEEIRKHPENPYAWSGRAFMYETFLGRPDKAAADYSKVIELKPDDRNALSSRALCYRRLKQWDKALADYAKAQELETKKDVSNEIFHARGNVYFEMKEWDKALADFSKVIQGDPKNGYNYWLRARVYLASGQEEKAIVDCSQGIKLNPEYRVLWQCRGASYQKLKQWDKAIADFTREIELAPKDGFSAGDWADRAQAYAAMKQWDKAIADYSQAIKLQSIWNDVWHDRAICYMELKQWDKAIADMSEGLKLVSDEDVDTSYHRAMLRLLASDAEGYRKICAAMLERFGSTENLDDLGVLIWTCVRAPNAVTDPAWVVKLAEKAMAKRSKGRDELEQLGAALYRAGRFNETVRRLTEANALDADPDAKRRVGPRFWLAPSPAYAWFFLAMGHMRLGHAAEARQWLDKAIQRTEQEFKLPLGLSCGGQNPSIPWNRKIALQLLRREAEALINAKDKAVPEERNQSRRARHR
jgi:tetratricopeptide (TPR) repeat protein